MASRAEDLQLSAVLGEAQQRGFLGPGPVEGHMRAAAGLAAALESRVPAPGGLEPAGFEATPPRMLDLGSGGGVPGLVLACRWPASTWVLLDSSERRTEFLRTAVRRLDLTARVEVRRARAEVAGRDPGLRGQFDLVVARSFGRPPVTAECAAPFLKVDGRLLVAEPPGRGNPAERWPADGIAAVGLQLEAGGVGPPAWTTLRQREPCPEHYPRRIGIPVKRPLYPS